MIRPVRTQLAIAVSAAAAGLGATAAVALAAGSPALGTARLQGTFALTGRVTVAVHVTGEYPGEPLSRTWTFLPLCTAGPCSSVRLIRGRATGTDTLALHLTAPGHYKGSGRFYAPLRCAGQIDQRGEVVPYTVKVRVTGASNVAGATVATSIAATYTNPKRVNLTPCVALPSHDAAIYQGHLQ